MPRFNRPAIAAGTLIAGSALGGMLALQSQPGADPTPEPRITAELTANTWTASTQYEPAMAASGDGHVLVAWASRRQEDGAFGVFAQLLDPMGRPVGTETHINQHTEGAQAGPAVAFDQNSGAALVVCAKGVEQGSLKPMSAVLAEEAPDYPALVLSGPTFAGEAAQGLPTAFVVAGEDRTVVDAVCARIALPTFRPYASDDVTAVEMGGAGSRSEQDSK